MLAVEAKDSDSKHSEKDTSNSFVISVPLNNVKTLSGLKSEFIYEKNYLSSEC